MSKLELALSLGLFLGGTSVAMAEPAKAPKSAEEHKLAEHLKLRKHIKSHVKYPASKEAVVSACKGMSEIKPEDRKWFTGALPEGQYENAAAVMEAVGWQVADAER
jgi:hypothetical protein